MLQQTQVDRVVPHYERFVEAFPTAAACAAAGPAEVVRRWSGLGYNRRALNLQRAATDIVDRHRGRVPSDDAALRTLPGVGPYTARAVRSFGFGHDVAAVDTNGVRVLARAVAGAPLTATAAFALGDRLVAARGLVGLQPVDVRPRCDRVHRAAPRLHALPPPASVRLASPRRGRPVARQPGGARPERVRRFRPPGPGPRSSRPCGAARCEATAIAEVCGWPDDVARADRVAAALVHEGFARWSGGAGRVLRLR